ncbi:MAG TPA: hypothetical protein VF018_15645 [Acidobacteriaceae bacterium]
MAPLSLSAPAQTAVYLDFTATNPDNWIYGGTAGFYHDPWHLFSAEAGVDARVSYLGNGQSPDTPRVSGVTAGPRLAFHPHVLPITPYAEVLAGGGHVRIGNANTGRFEYQIVGGIDLKIISRLDWRFFDYAYTGYPGLNVGYRRYYAYPDVNSSFSPKMLSTGLVLRLP